MLRRGESLDENLPNFSFLQARPAKFVVSADSEFVQAPLAQITWYALFGLSDSIEIGIHQSIFHEENPSLLAVSLLDMRKFVFYLSHIVF